MYCSYDQVVERLGGQLGAAGRTFLESKIAVACTAIDDWCGQFFTTLDSATARTFEPVDEHEVWTDPFWTTDGLVVQVDYAGAGIYITVDPSGFILDRFGGNRADQLGSPYDTLISTTSAWPRHRRSVRVTAKWGWAICPPQVVEAAEILTVELWARKDTPFGITQTTPDFAGLRIGRDVMAQAASLLERYRRVDNTTGIA